MKNLKFELNEEHMDKFENWVKTHECNYLDRISARKACGFEGGVITISFTITGMGNIIKVKCNACGKEHDITDYEAF